MPARIDSPSITWNATLCNTNVFTSMIQFPTILAMSTFCGRGSTFRGLLAFLAFGSMVLDSQ